MEKEIHPPGGLLPDDGGLVFASARASSGPVGTGWPDCHPLVGTPVASPGRRVRHALEALGMSAVVLW